MCKQHHSVIFQHHLCLSSVLGNCSATSNNFFFFLLKLLPNSIEVSFLVKIWNFSKTLHDSSWSLIKMVQMRINTLDKLSRKQSQRSCCLCRRVPLCLRWGCYCIYVRIDSSGAGESERQPLLQRTRVRATAPTRQLTVFNSNSRGHIAIFWPLQARTPCRIRMHRHMQGKHLYYFFKSFCKERQEGATSVWQRRDFANHVTWAPTDRPFSLHEPPASWASRFFLCIFPTLSSALWITTLAWQITIRQTHLGSLVP